MCLHSLQIRLDSNGTRLVTEMLSHISSTHFQEVGLQAHIGICEIDHVDWNEVDAALQHSSFAGLRTVTILLVHWLPPQDAGFDTIAYSILTVL